MLSEHILFNDSIVIHSVPMLWSMEALLPCFVRERARSLLLFVILLFVPCLVLNKYSLNECRSERAIGCLGSCQYKNTDKAVIYMLAERKSLCLCLIIFLR